MKTGFLIFVRLIEGWWLCANFCDKQHPQFIGANDPNTDMIDELGCQLKKLVEGTMSLDNTEIHIAL